jgi:hypothetical protein
MKSEDDPSTEDELLLRRVHKDRFPSEKCPFLSPNAFEPRTKGNDVDSDGISLYRAECLTPDDILSAISEDKRPHTGLVRVSVEFLRSLGLTVVPCPDQDIKGHVVIPELNSEAYKADKAKFTTIKEKLAKTAGTEENIVRRARSADVARSVRHILRKNLVPTQSRRSNKLGF